MADDLNLAQTLGGLRIANPDKLNPGSPKEEMRRRPLSMSWQASTSSTSAPAPDQNQSLLTLPDPRHASDQSPSLIGDRSKATSPSAQSSPRTPTAERTPSTNGFVQDPHLSPPNYHVFPKQDQHHHQHLQYPQQPSTMNVSSHHQHHHLHQTSPSPPGRSSRPFSVLPQTSPPSAASLAANVPSDRLRSESSRSSLPGLPKRSSSRTSPSPLLAGVPSQDGGHSDRSYRQSQPFMAPSGPTFFPRKAATGKTEASASGSPSMPHITSSGSPNFIEGGPLPSSEEWKDRGAARGIQREIDRDGRPVSKYVKKGVKDFNFGRTLGEGSYSTVVAATDRQTLREYAVKVLDKRHIIKEKKVKYVNIEKDTLNRLTDHPGIVRLYYTFQDERSLYFVLDVASGGELLGVLKRMTTFDEECTRFYGAQILDAVDYMHSRGVIHRDLKPENVLLDDAMHVKITDFGTAKILDPPRTTIADGSHENNGGYPSSFPGGLLAGMKDDRANSFVGTAEYVSPELLTNKSACKASDLWAFGCIIYQLLAGRPPFKAGNEYQTFQKIVGLEYDFPPGFPPVAKDLVERLLVLDPANRLSIEHIKHHEFFQGIVWGRGLWKQKAPRLKSYVPHVQATHPMRLESQPNNAPPQSLPRPSVQGQASNGHLRPQPRVITELPPPSQVDIEWSPVLTSTDERILKLGNWVVQSGPASSSPNLKNVGNGESTVETTPKRFSRFFGGSAVKRRPRLVMITSSARIVIVAANGEEKKTKTEVSLISAGCSWRTVKDAKGGMAWSVETRDKRFIFEDVKPTYNNNNNNHSHNNTLSVPTPTSVTSANNVTNTTNNNSAQEWIDTIERAIELARFQAMNNGGGHSADSNLSFLPMINSESLSSSLGPVGDLGEFSGNHHYHQSSSSKTGKHHGRGGGGGGGGGNYNGRLSKNMPLMNGGDHFLGSSSSSSALASASTSTSTPTTTTMATTTSTTTAPAKGGRRKFSKRHSKNGLTAVF